MSYREEIKINKYELENLWEDHHERFMRWAEAYAEAIKERDEIKYEFDLKRAEAKNNLDAIRSKLDIEIRTKYKIYGFENRPSDKLAESWIVSNDLYREELKKIGNLMKEYYNKIAKSDYNVNVLKSVKESFEHRKTAMDNLTRLMISGYYSTKLPKELKDDIIEKREAEIERRRKERYNK